MGYTPSFGGSTSGSSSTRSGYVPSFAATGSMPEDGHDAFLSVDTVGNVLSGLGGLVGGALGLVGSLGHDIGKSISYAIPGHQGIEDDDFRTVELGKTLLGLTPEGFHPLDDASLLGGIYDRYSPLLPGGEPAATTWTALQEDPVSFGLDALGAGSIAGKVAGKVGLGLAEGSEAANAARLGTLEDLKSAGIGAHAAERAATRSGLDVLASEGKLGLGGTLARKALPSATAVRVGDVLEPAVTNLNPVSRAVMSSFKRLGTEEVSSLARRVSDARSEIDSYMGVRGMKLDEAGQVLTDTKPSKQLLQMVTDYRISKKLLDDAEAYKLTRISNDKAAHSLAGGIARRLLGQVGAEGLARRNERMQRYVATIGGDIVEHPEIASQAAARWQGLDVDIEGLDTADWVGRPLEFEGLETPRNIRLGTPEGMAQTGGVPYTPALEDIAARHPEVTLDVHENPAGIIEVSRIIVPDELRNQGLGTAAMNDILNYADETGQSVALTASPDFGGKVGQLREFYSRFGFRPNRGQKRDFRTREALIRDPVPKAPAHSLQAPSGVGGGVPLRLNIDEATREAARLAAPDWLERTDDVVSGWQQVRQELLDNEETLAANGYDVADQLDSVDRIIDHLNAGVSEILGDDPHAATAAKVRLLTMEDGRALWEQGVTMPSQMLERAYEPLRMKYGAKFNRIDDAWEGGPNVKELDDALRAAGTQAPIYFPHIDPAEIGPWELFRSKRRVGGVQAAADPHLRRNTGKLLEQGSYITDPVEAFSRRAARAVRAEETFNVFNAYAHRFGRLLQPGEVPGSNEVLWVPQIQGLARRTGLSIQDLMDDLTSSGVTKEESAAQALKVMEDHADYVGDLLSGGKPVKVYAVPRKVAEQLDAAAKWAKVFGPSTTFGAFYDSFMNAWRHLTLFTRPAYVMNQFLGNTVWAELQGAGVKPAVEVLERRIRAKLASKLGRTLDDPVIARLDEFPGYRGMGSSFFGSLEHTYTPRNPRAEASRIGRAAARAGETKGARFAKAWMETERKMAVELDNAFRASGYLTAAERATGVSTVRRFFRRYRSLSTRMDKLLKAGFGDDLSVVKDALDEAKRFYGDFFSLTPFERHVVRRYMFPFYGFTKHNIKLMVQFPLEYPGRAELMDALARADEEMRSEYGPLPDYLDNSVPFGPAGGVVPFFGLRGANPFEGAMQNPLQQLAPLPKVAIEQMLGRNLFTNQPFTAENVITPFGSDQPFEILPDGSVVPAGKVTPPLLEHLLRQFPLYSYAERFATGDATTYDSSTLADMLAGGGVVRDDTGQPYDQEGRLSVLGALFGLPVNEVDTAAYRDRLARDLQAALTAAQNRSAA